MSNSDSVENTGYKVFTVCNLAYLPKALVLAESLAAFNHPKLKIFIFDKKIEGDLPHDLADFEWVEDLGLENFSHYAFKYDITEFSTSLKPWLALRLLESAQKVIFLDPDTCLFNSLDPILNLLDEEEIILTPHYVTPHPEGDVGMMRFGSFNLGFFAVNSSSESVRFLNWWNERCLDLCYFETQFGLSTDQKWVSIAPCFFPKLHISFDLGFNVAFWNAHERVVSVNPQGGYLINNEYRLIFFHFSSFDEKNPDLLSKREFADRETGRTDYSELAHRYNKSLQRLKIPISKTRYGFDYMSNGDYVSPTLRRAYASVLNDLPRGHDPFDSNGPVAAFAKKNYLISDKSGYQPTGFGDIESNKSKFLIVNKLMKMALYALGPNRFMNFSRLLVYLSSFRLNRDMWKL
ncbi:putative nucleotide-diphospho-sugar transferase [Pseudomonas sp. Y24-6]|uniref:putative nucleotide-diphospho-sugar transferase n=1 Tax=Pseudomonas sp. Y24-6 TaxID=2750013 RepID=UPI001CE1BF02|nr:putative nucleotide-diphospho-sugar transferase [Pseudomonas sp. Y24-6]MCA4961873.1 hypothetical protein [Pseudomonas sp. Y24-6]